MNSFRLRLKFYKGLTRFLLTRFKKKSWKQNLYYSDGFQRKLSFYNTGCHSRFLLVKLLSLICNDLLHITSIKYFTDGAVSRCNYFKALIKLEFHFHDHKLTAEHNFFAKSNGKSPWDGTGGTVKREVANASLRATIDDQIITPEDLYCWAKNNIKGVTLFYVPSI